MKRFAVVLTFSFVLLTGAGAFAAQQLHFGNPQQHLFSADESIPDDDEDTCWVAPEWRDDFEDCWVAPEWLD